MIIYKTYKKQRKLSKQWMFNKTNNLKITTNNIAFYFCLVRWFFFSYHLKIKLLKNKMLIGVMIGIWHRIVKIIVSTNYFSF